MTEQQATLPTWARTLSIVVGFVSMGAAFIVLLFPGVAVLTLVLLLGIGLLFIGFDRLIDGISGQPYRWFVVAPVVPVGPADPAQGAPKSSP